jgi:4-amino-4-deoxychorismate lyase
MQRVSINGIETQHLPVMDRGIQYGDGLFETVAYKDGALQFWDEHIFRMKCGAEKLGIAFPGDEKYYQDIKNLLDQAPDENCVIKLLLTRGSATRGYRQAAISKPTRAALANPWPDYQEDIITNQGIKIHVCKHPISTNPVLAGIKHLNRLDNVLARNEWGDEFHEGLMSDTHGNVIEGTMSNVFFIKNGILLTPDLERCGVNGIIRNQILSIARENNIETHIRNINNDEIDSMDEIFITNSIIAIWPVKSVNDNQYSIGNMTRNFETELKQRMRINAKTFA